ncbi:MAG: iron ABC transporter permease [Xanthomonadales bacterium]|nr:iron ABC transporter permease [Xanthomonadales bacterium]
MSAALGRQAVPASRRRWSRSAVVVMVALLACAPLLLALVGLAGAWLTPVEDVWPHLLEHVLPRATTNTLALMAIVGVGCTLIGTTCAWLNARCDYPGRRLFDWAMLLPLALPTYVVAFVAIGLFDYAGPIQSLWREWSGSRTALFTPYGLGWAAAMLTLCFYPYVYLTLRAVLLRQSDDHVAAARTLGLSPLRAFWRVRLPLLRPALMAGLGLALLETLAEFGAVSLFGVDTLTTAVYKTWFGLYSLPAAAQLASVGLLLALLLLGLEWRARSCQRQYGGQRLRPVRHRLGAGLASLAIGGQSLLLLVAFVLPIIQLLAWASTGAGRGAADLSALWNTVKIGALAAVLLVAAGLLLVTMHRHARSLTARGLLALATMGYGIPGTVLAAGLLLGVLMLESTLAGIGLGRVVLTGSIAALLLALYVRFLRAATEPLAASLGQMKPSLFCAARTLGAGRWRRTRQLLLPLLRPGVFAASLLVAIEVMKEMPATLMMRPFGWDTLAVRIYAFTIEGMWHEAALPSLILVGTGLVAIWLLVRLQERG